MSKKILSVLLVLALVLSAVPMVLAQTAEPVKTLQGYFTTLSEANMLIADEVLYDLEGNEIAKTTGLNVYDGSRYFRVTSTSTGLEGMISQDGKQIIPCDYENIQIKDDWAICFNYVDSEDPQDYDVLGYRDGKWDRAMIISKADVYNWQTGKLAATLVRENFVEWAACGSYINIVDRDYNLHCYDADFNEVSSDAEYVYQFPHARTEYTYEWDEDTDLAYLTDQNGNVLSEAKYDYISITEGMDVFETDDPDGKVGLIDSTGRELLPNEFDEICTVWYQWGYEGTQYQTVGVYAGMADGICSLIDPAKGTRVDVDVSGADVVEFYGDCLTAEFGDELVVYNVKGEKVTMPENVVDLEAWTYNPAGTFFMGADAETDQDVVVDLTGAILAQDDSCSITCDGHIVTYNYDAFETTVYKVQ